MDVHRIVSRREQCSKTCTANASVCSTDERVGALAVVTNGSDAGALARTMGQLRLLVRQTYSNPPQHGARIVANVLGNPALNAEWRANVRTMADRIQVLVLY